MSVNIYFLKPELNNDGKSSAEKMFVKGRNINGNDSLIFNHYILDLNYLWDYRDKNKDFYSNLREIVSDELTKLKSPQNKKSDTTNPILRIELSDKTVFWIEYPLEKQQNKLISSLNVFLKDNSSFDSIAHDNTIFKENVLNFDIKKILETFSGFNYKNMIIFRKIGENRVFAIVYGQAGKWLSTTASERFGLKVFFKSPSTFLTELQVISIFSQNQKFTKERLRNPTENFEGFSLLYPYGEMLLNVKGTLNIENNEGKETKISVSAGKNLELYFNIDSEKVPSIDSLLNWLYKTFNSAKYQKLEAGPFIDNIEKVSDPLHLSYNEQTLNLNSFLYNFLTNSPRDLSEKEIENNMKMECYVYCPDFESFFSGEKIYIRYNGSKNSVELPEDYLDNFLNTNKKSNENLTMRERILKVVGLENSNKLKEIEESKEKISKLMGYLRKTVISVNNKEFSALKFISLVLSLNPNDKTIYFLSNREWYKFTDKGVANIINMYEHVSSECEKETKKSKTSSRVPYLVEDVNSPIYKLVFEDEGEYNWKICEANENLIYFDKENFYGYIENKYNYKLEICDFYDFKNDIFFHVKRYENSEKLAHLFNQGNASAQILNFLKQPQWKSGFDNHRSIPMENIIKENIRNQMKLKLLIKFKNILKNQSFLNEEDFEILSAYLLPYQSVTLDKKEDEKLNKVIEILEENNLLNDEKIKSSIKNRKIKKWERKKIITDIIFKKTQEELEKETKKIKENSTSEIKTLVEDYKNLEKNIKAVEKLNFNNSQISFLILKEKANVKENKKTDIPLLAQVLFLDVRKILWNASKPRECSIYFNYVTFKNKK